MNLTFEKENGYLQITVIVVVSTEMTNSIEGVVTLLKTLTPLIDVLLTILVVI